MKQKKQKKQKKHEKHKKEKKQKKEKKEKKEKRCKIINYCFTEWTTTVGMAFISFFCTLSIHSPLPPLPFLHPSHPTPLLHSDGLVAYRWYPLSPPLLLSLSSHSCSSFRLTCSSYIDGFHCSLLSATFNKNILQILLQHSNIHFQTLQNRFQHSNLRGIYKRFVPSLFYCSFIIFFYSSILFPSMFNFSLLFRYKCHVVLQNCGRDLLHVVFCDVLGISKVILLPLFLFPLSPFLLSFLPLPIFPSPR